MSIENLPLEDQFELNIAYRSIDNIDNITTLRNVAKEYLTAFAQQRHINKEMLKQQILNNDSFIIL